MPVAQNDKQTFRILKSKTMAHPSLLVWADSGLLAHLGRYYLALRL